MSDQEFKSDPFRIGNPFAMPTDDKLKADAASIVNEYIHYWNKDEVECMVILSRKGSRRPAYAYSQMDRERVMRILQLTEADLVISVQKAMISKGQKR